MNTTISNSVDRLQVLQNVLNEATEEASSAMGIWSGGAIRLTLERLREIPLEQVALEFDLGMDLLTMVVLTIGGDVGGTFILTFDEENGRRLAASLTKTEVSAGSDWTELEQSALTETGNILGCAYFNRIAKLVGGEFVPSPPTFLQDYGVCVLQQALMEQLQETADVLICQTTFFQGKEKLNCHILFVPHPHMRAKLNTSID